MHVPASGVYGLCRCRAKLKESWRASEMSHLLKDVEQTDLVQFGLIPEFVGRFPVLCSLQVPRIGLPAAPARPKNPLRYSLRLC